MQIIAFASFLSLGIPAGQERDPSTRDILTTKLPGDWESRPTVISFFQTDCQPCRAVWKELRCLQEAGWSVVTVGLGSNPLQLRQEWLHQGRPGVLITKSFRDAQQKLNVTSTPTLWWRQSSNEPWSRTGGGDLSCNQLLTPAPATIP
jgi:thiol-disulfide isomerase/thioredoxin